MADSLHHELAKKLVAQLQEKETAATPLHLQSDLMAEAGQLDQAVRLCWSSADVAHRNNDDDYMFGAARFHMALAYFVAGTEKEWDRAAELCEQAAHHFEMKHAEREQGVALVARAQILQALCELGQDRWQQALRACAEGYALLRVVSKHLGEDALIVYGTLGRKYVEKGLVDESNAKAAATAAAADPVSANTAAASASDTPNPDTGGPPLGLRSPRAVVGRGFSRWEFITIVGVVGLVTMITVLAGMELDSLLTKDTQLGYLFAFAVFVSFAAVLTVVITLLLTTQLTFTLPDNQTAVIIEGGRIWTYDEPHRYWLRPFRQDLVALVPKTWHEYQKFVPDVAILDDQILNANVHAKYKVSAADRFWNRVLSCKPRTTYLGIPCQLAPQTIEEELNMQAHALLQSTVIQITNDPEKRKLAADETIFHSQVCALLETEAAKDGIAFDQVSFRVMSTFKGPSNGTN